MVQKIVHFTGRVQGVGFRFTTVRIARDFEVGGYVQNLPDGRVKLVAEGEADAVKQFVAAVKAKMSHYIERSDIAESPATAEFAPGSFDIRY